MINVTTVLTIIKKELGTRCGNHFTLAEKYTPRPTVGKLQQIKKGELIINIAQGLVMKLMSSRPVQEF